MTVSVLSLVTRLPYGSSSATIGWVVKGAPAVAVVDGCSMTTSLVGAAGLTTMFADVADVRLPLENSSEKVPAVSKLRVVKVATPPVTTAESLPRRGPTPLASDTVTTVVLSEVTRFPNPSSS